MDCILVIACVVAFVWIVSAFVKAAPTVQRLSRDIPAKKESKQVTKAFVLSQLNGQDRFIESYDMQMKALSQNAEFQDFITSLRNELNGLEITDTTAANRRIANYFYYKKANMRFPEVQYIANHVRKYGTQASAHISIYYAMFIYE